METIRVYIKKTTGSSDLQLPRYMSTQAAGMDLAADIGESILIEPGKRKSIPTGISIALPEGYEAQIRPRSGLALKHGITVLNSPGTIDPDFRGEICIILINLGEETFEIKKGDRIAQMVINKVEKAELIEVTELPYSQRSSGGFGSTGV